MNPSPLWHLAVDFGQFDAFDVPPPIAPDQMACFLELQAETQYGEAGAFKMRQLLFFIRLCKIFEVSQFIEELFGSTFQL